MDGRLSRNYAVQTWSEKLIKVGQESNMAGHADGRRNLQSNAEVVRHFRYCKGSTAWVMDLIPEQIPTTNLDDMAFALG